MTAYLGEGGLVTCSLNDVHVLNNLRSCDEEVLSVYVAPLCRRTNFQRSFL